MKKVLFLAIVMAVSAIVLTACSVHDSDEKASTTAITDENGNTHFYEIVIDKEGSSQLTEIETASSGNSVLQQNSSLNEGKKTETNTSAAASGNADNEVPFEFGTDNSLDTPKPNTTVSSDKRESIVSNPPATDKDGWINKWY